MRMTHISFVCLVAAGPVAGCLGLADGSSSDPGDAGEGSSTSCSDECKEGASQCVTGVASQTCAKGASGCFEWQDPAGCSDGETCSLGFCAQHGTWKSVAKLPAGA